MITFFGMFLMPVWQIVSGVLPKVTTKVFGCGLAVAQQIPSLVSTRLDLHLNLDLPEVFVASHLER